MLHKSIASACAFASAVMVSAGVSAQTNPRILLQNSPVFALNNEVRAFRVPVTNSGGVVRFFDVVVRLSVNARGDIGPTAVVTSSPSLVLPTGVIPPGTYRASNGTVCVGRNINLQGGRVQSFFTCTNASGPQLEFAVANGRVSSGHPYLAPLTAAGIPRLADVDTYTWGLVTGRTGSTIIGGCNAFLEGNVVGAKTNGNILSLSVFDDIATNPDFRCGATLTKQ